MDQTQTMLTGASPITEVPIQTSPDTKIPMQVSSLTEVQAEKEKPVKGDQLERSPSAANTIIASPIKTSPTKSSASH